MERTRVELAPFSQGRRALDGFIVAGRWPDTTAEWAELLRMLLRIAAVPGMIDRTAVFRSNEDRIEAPALEHPVGMLVCEGPVVGRDAPAPGALGHPQPSAVLLLHPPEESRTAGTSGCVLLPGLPHLGLDHRAAWVAADREGTVTRLVSRSEVDPSQDPDTAVLALLLAA